MSEQGDTPVKEFCRFCGHQLSPTAKFCGGCGKKRPEQVAAAPIAPVVEAPKVETPKVEVPVAEVKKTPVKNEPAKPVEEELPDELKNYVPTKKAAPSKVVYQPINPKNLGAKPASPAAKVEKPAEVKVEVAKPVAKKAAASNSVKAEPVKENYSPKVAATPRTDPVRNGGKSPSRAPIMVGIAALAIALIAVIYSSTGGSSSSTTSSGEVQTTDVPSDVPSDTPADPTPSATPSSAPSKPAPKNTSCVINSGIATDISDLGNLANNIPAGSNDAANVPIILDWAQSASDLAMGLANDEGNSSGKVSPLLGKAGEDLGNFAELIRSWGQKKVASPKTLQNDIVNGQKTILSDFNQISSLCKGKI